MEDSKQEKPLKKGEVLIFTEDYDVIGTNVNGLEGMYYRHTSCDKYLVFAEKTGEWCEPKISWVKRKRPGFVPKRFKQLCSRIITMKITYGTT